MPVSPATLAAFSAASFLLLVIPGPTIVMVVGQALAHGRRAALASVAGVALGDLAAATLSLIGIGAVLAASAAVFLAVKWIGALYLVHLGIRMWRAPMGAPGVGAAGIEEAVPRAAIFRRAFLVTLLNPKSIVFFVAFLPQFIRRDAPFLPQAVLLVGCFVLLATLNATGYAVAAASARRLFRRETVLRRAGRAGGAFMIGAGMVAAFAHRAA